MSTDTSVTIAVYKEAARKLSELNLTLIEQAQRDLHSNDPDKLKELDDNINRVSKIVDALTKSTNNILKLDKIPDNNNSVVGDNPEKPTEFVDANSEIDNSPAYKQTYSKRRQDKEQEYLQIVELLKNGIDYKGNKLSKLKRQMLEGRLKKLLRKEESLRIAS